MHDDDDDDDDKISQFPHAGSTQNAEEWGEGESELLFRKATRKWQRAVLMS